MSGTREPDTKCDPGHPSAPQIVASLSADESTRRRIEYAGCPLGAPKKGGASMSKKKSRVAGLGALYARACGFDVDMQSVVACVSILDAKDGTVQSTLRRVGPMTAA